MQMFTVYKIENDKESGKPTVYAQDSDESKKKRRKVSSEVIDPTSYFVGQKVRVALEDAS